MATPLPVSTAVAAFMAAADAAAAATALGLGTGDSPTFAKTFMDGGNNSILRVGQLDGGGNFYLLSDLTAAGTARGLVVGTGVNKPITFDVNGVAVWQMTTTGLVGSGSFLQLGDASTPSSPTSAANILSSGGILSGQNSGESAALPLTRTVGIALTALPAAIQPGQDQVVDITITGYNPSTDRVMISFDTSLPGWTGTGGVSIGAIYPGSGIVQVQLVNSDLINIYNLSGNIYVTVVR